MLAIGFTASMIAVQAAVSRAIWASARAHELPLAKVLGRLTGPERLPRHVIGVTAVIGGVLLFVHNPKAYTLLLSASTAGFFLSYSMPVVAAAFDRLKRRWTPGPVSMGRWSGPVTYFAAVWIVAETVNIAWPRDVYAGVWYLNWSIVIMAAVLAILGFAVQAYVLRPGGDAAEAAFAEPDVVDVGEA
jgi:amino acid transporter